jgi:competence protein ComEA
MTPEERRSLLTAVGTLLLVSLLRFGWESRQPAPFLPPDPDVLPGLLNATEAALRAEERRRTPLSEGEVLELNVESEIELARLPGVGPALARRIVGSRSEEGAFQSVDDLVRVPGIGPRTLERLRPHLSTAAGRGEISPGARIAQDPGLSASGRVAVNRASVEELQALAGVGPVLARRIEEDRAQNGPYHSPEDLLRVAGIGPTTLERIRAQVALP